MYQHPIRRDRGSFAPLVTGGLFVAALVVGAGIVGLGLLRNPFATHTVDRSAPVVLTELRDLADFHAAQAQFEIVIDQEDDVRLVPQFIAGERVQYVAVGHVDAIVDFSGITAASIDESIDGAVSIVLPAPVLDEPVLDPDQSHVMNRDRGLLDRVGGAFVDNPTSEQPLIEAATDKMATAAAATDLRERAEVNTTRMLQTMLGALGYEDVSVEFTSAA